MDAAFAEPEKRVLQLSDGRVVFLPNGTSGRAYRIRDHRHGQRLSTELTWVDRLTSLAAVAALGAAKFLDDWRLAVFAIPAFVGPTLARRVVVWGLEEVTDTALGREVRLEPDAIGRPAPPENTPIVPR